MSFYTWKSNTNIEWVKLVHEMGKAKYSLDQVTGYEENAREQVENNLKAFEGNIVRLMKDLTDRKSYDLVKELERVRKRFNFLSQKAKNIFPQHILRAEEKAKYSDPVTVNCMILLDELLHRDSILFNKLLPQVEALIQKPEAQEELRVILNHISLMLTRMERVMTLKIDVRNSTGINALKNIRQYVPELFPKHFRQEIKRELEKNNFENVELNLLQDERYEKYFFQDIIGPSTAYEQDVLESVLDRVDAKFEVIEMSLEDLKIGQDALQQTQEALGGGIELVYRELGVVEDGQENILDHIDELKALVEDQVKQFLKDDKEKTAVEQKVRNLAQKLDNASPAERDKLGPQLLDAQANYLEVTERLEVNLNSISNGIFAILDKQDNMDVYMKSNLGSNWQNLQSQWKLMKEGRISRKAFIYSALKTVGMKMLSVFSPVKF